MVQNNQLETAIKRLAEGCDSLTASEAEGAFRVILSGEADPIQISAFLMGLRIRGETVSELTAGARIMRANAKRVEVKCDVVDTCGTGGTGRSTLNISTAAAIVAAAAGVKVTKHGNRSTPPRTGSADVLEQLGVRLTDNEAILQKCLDEAGLMFLFAANHHSAMRHVAPTRRILNTRTIFNLLGPLSNPSGAKRQLLGVFSDQWLRPMAETLRELGTEHAWVVHGHDGLDEITITGETLVCELRDGHIREFSITPEEAGILSVSGDKIAGGPPEENAESIIRLINGDKSPFRDIVLLNTAAILQIAEKVHTFKDGVELAADTIASHAAYQTLNRLIELTQLESPDA